MTEPYVKASIEKSVRIYVVEEELSRKLLRDNNYVRNAEAASNVMMFERLVNLAGDLAFSNLRERLMRCLMEYGAEAENGEICVTHEELANNLGTSREVVSRLLKDMAKEGHLSMQRKRIILNKDKTLLKHD